MWLADRLAAAPDVRGVPPRDPPRARAGAPPAAREPGRGGVRQARAHPVGGHVPRAQHAALQGRRAGGADPERLRHHGALRPCDLHLGRGARRPGGPPGVHGPGPGRLCRQVLWRGPAPGPGRRGARGDIPGGRGGGPRARRHPGADGGGGRGGRGGRRGRRRGGAQARLGQRAPARPSQPACRRPAVADRRPADRKRRGGQRRHGQQAPPADCRLATGPARGGDPRADAGAHPRLAVPAEGLPRGSQLLARARRGAGASADDA
mmetsp:Transcript_9706/g.32915  ORF Transcript_9706/g.32915 Transcript_9706/m.32915 type:complete len:264 (+) Transcript_9706:576-1367(+)